MIERKDMLQEISEKTEFGGSNHRMTEKDYMKQFSKDEILSVLFDRYDFERIGKKMCLALFESLGR